MYTPHLVYPFINQWILGLFPPLAIVDKAMSTGVQISVQGLAFNSLGYILRRGIVGS